MSRLPDRPDRPARVRLGAELRGIRKAAGRTVTQIPGYKRSQISLVENGLVNPSWELVNEYVKLGGDRDLLRQLYERMRAETEAQRSSWLRGDRPQDTPPATVGTETLHEDIRKHYILRVREEDYAFDAAGIVTVVRCRCGLVATSDGVRLFVARHTYDGDPRPDVLRVHATTGCTDHVQRTFADSSLVEAYLELDRPIGPADGTYELGYRVEVISDQPASPRIQFRATGELEYFDLTARFQPPALPASIWCFAAPDTLAVEKRSADNRVLVDTDGRCHRRFKEPAAGWYYGFTWIWPTPDP
jgi:hypothetical protein